MKESFESILDKIIIERRRRKISYDDIVEGAKISRPTLSNILNPNKRNLVKVGNVLKVIDYIESVEVK
jgi:predicted transcriptional regulator